jgi:hypothetical protein
VWVGWVVALEGICAEMRLIIDPMTWSPTITELVEKKMVGLRPFDLELNYDDWTMRT